VVTQDLERHPWTSEGATTQFIYGARRKKTSFEAWCRRNESGGHRSKLYGDIRKEKHHEYELMRMCSKIAIRSAAKGERKGEVLPQFGYSRPRLLDR